MSGARVFFASWMEGGVQHDGQKFSTWTAAGNDAMRLNVEGPYRKRSIYVHDDKGRHLYREWRNRAWREPKLTLKPVRKAQVVS